MKRLFIIFFVLFSSCSKPDETIFEPTEDLICVDCVDQLSHLAFLDAFCGTDQEADRFITEAKEAAANNGMIIYCIKKR